MAKFSVVAADFIAASAAFNMSFWADSPITRTIWAVSDDQQFHLIRVDRKGFMAEHVCGRSLEKGTMERSTCPGTFTARSFPNLAACAEVSGVPLVDLVAASTHSAQLALDLFNTTYLPPNGVMVEEG